MNVLIACEESQRVCIAFRNKGHEAYSCDILPCSGNHPEWHIIHDAIPLLNGLRGFHTQNGKFHEINGWDMIIAFPPCTHLCVFGARWFEQKRKDGRQQEGIDFFMQFVNANCKKIAIENPIGIMSSVYRKPDQIIHPWMFGDNYSKSTCLWLKGLPLLIPDVTEQPELEWFDWVDGKTGKKKRQPKWFADAWHLPPEERAKVRSKTFLGIARAMAEQWG